MKDVEQVVIGEVDPSASNGGDGKKESRSRDSRKERALYPKYTLDEALEIARTIRENFAGKPISPQSLAEACGTSYGNCQWRVKLAASSQYGLTEGSYNAPSISLTPRAQSILAPRSPEERLSAMREAARTPEALRGVYDFYDNGRIPEGEFFVNTLQRDFRIPADQCERFTSTLRANAKYVYAEPGAGPGDQARPASVAPESMEAREREEVAQVAEVIAHAPKPAEMAARVFISHSDNEEILDVLRTTMEVAGFEYDIAEDEETTALPVPSKIIDLMQRCSAAIINISADEREVRADGSLGVNQNVLIEIGCAFVLYGQARCILLWDKAVDVPSNLQGLYRCEYSNGTLSAADLLKLQKAIANFRCTDASGA